VLTAAEALSAGLVSRVIPDAAFEAECGKLLASLAATSGSALALTKRQFYQLDGLPFEEGIALGAQVNALARSAPYFKRAIAAFFKK
jgi:enoyl-CoA hydratase/carnithine racemase